LPFPKRDWSVAGTGHRQTQQLWFLLFAESEAFCAAEVRTAFKLAVDKHFELVITGRHIPYVDPLHAALPQSIEFFEAVDVVRDELTVNLEPHSVEAHLVALSQRDEDRDLCP